MVTRVEAPSYNNETNEIIESSRTELNILERTTKDYEKFQTLSKDVELKKGLNKLYDVSSKEVFGEEWKKFETINISNELNNILNKYPDLWLKIVGDLKLPLGETKFSNLTTQQKLNYSVLHEAVHGNSVLYKKNPDSKNNQNRINKNFRNKNISNFLQLEKTLKEDFKLTSTEAGKVKEYLELIKKHPEFVGDMKVIEAGNTGGYIVVAVLALALGAVGMHFIDNIGKINPETTKNIGETVVEEPEAILYLLTQKFAFSTSGSIKKKMFTESENPDGLIEIGKNLLKRGINLFETKELNMEMIGDLALKYDLDGSSLTVNHSTGEVVLRVKKPDIIIIDSNAEVTYSNGEVVELDAFRNAEIELEDNLKQKAIKEAKNNPRFYDVAKKQTEQDLQELFKEIKPYGVDVTRVRVEYINGLTTPRE